MVSFDFAGTGNSDGDYLTLGYYEYQDIEAVINKVMEFTFIDINQLTLWGRSMGAVSCIRYAAFNTNDPKVKAVCLDSPFTDLA